jgi:hypothetical protein
VLTYTYSYSYGHFDAYPNTYIHTKTYSDATTSPKSAASPDANTLMRLTEKVGRLGFAPVQAGKSTRVCVC